jgi:hypothetical protein
VSNLPAPGFSFTVNSGDTNIAPGVLLAQVHDPLQAPPRQHQFAHKALNIRNICKVSSLLTHRRRQHSLLREHARYDIIHLQHQTALSFAYKALPNKHTLHIMASVKKRRLWCEESNLGKNIFNNIIGFL